MQNIDLQPSQSSSTRASRYSSSATPSPTRSQYKTPPSTAALSSSNSSSSSNRRSSLPAPPPTSTTATGRVIRPPLNNDAGWSASGGEETERENTSDAHSRSSGGSSRAERPLYSRAAFSGSSAGGPEVDYQSSPSNHASHSRASSLDLSGSEGGLSRRSSRSAGGGSTRAQHAQTHSLSSIDDSASTTPPKPLPPSVRLLSPGPSRLPPLALASRPLPVDRLSWLVRAPTSPSTASSARRRSVRGPTLRSRVSLGHSLPCAYHRPSGRVEARLRPLRPPPPQARTPRRLLERTASRQQISRHRLPQDRRLRLVRRGFLQLRHRRSDLPSRLQKRTQTAGQRPLADRGTKEMRLLLAERARFKTLERAETETDGSGSRVAERRGRRCRWSSDRTA
jgi:hypothetical protein